MTRTVAETPPRLIDPPKSGFEPHPSTGVRSDPAFLLDGKQRLYPHHRDRAEEFKSLLSHAIVRRPGELRLHVQRILLCIDSRDPTVLGALCDLFLVLGRNGSGLRRRLLNQARPLLSRMDYGKLLAQLDAETTQSPALDNLCAGATLSRGVTGTTQLISRRQLAAAEPEDPLVSARQQLEYGQTALAQETLEQALAANPERLALHLALLEIYRHTRDRLSVTAYWHSLRGIENPAATEWQRLLRQLEEEA